MAYSIITKNKLYRLLNYVKRESLGYYVLVPEVPRDTSSDNAIMMYNDLPKFSQINPDKVITGCSKLALEYDVEFGKHIESLKLTENEITFDKVFRPIEKIYFPMNTAWRTAKNLNYTCGQKFRNAFQRIHPQVERSKNERWVSDELYEIVQKLRTQPNLTTTELRLIDMYLMEGRLNGIELKGNDKRQFTELLGKLVDSKNHFRNRVMLSTNMFSHMIYDFQEVSEMPPHIAANLAEDSLRSHQGPWRINLQPKSVDAVLKYCPNRATRWNIWQAYNNRASIKHDDQNLSNHNLIKDIRHYRNDLSKLLGFENFAEMSMQTKMAGSVENVLHVSEYFRSNIAPLLQKQFKELSILADKDGVDEIKMWDVAYYRRKIADKKYYVDEATVAQYFPLESVLKNLFSFFKTAFNIEIINKTNEVETWHEDVMFFQVYDSDSKIEIASFYADLWKRKNKMYGAWMEVGREKSEMLNCNPFCYLNMSISKFGAQSNSFLTLKDLQILLYEFGHGLQQMLTTVDLCELAGQRNIEWDAVQTIPYLFNKLLYTPDFLSLLSCHYKTKEPLPDDIIQNIIGRHNHMIAYDLMKILYLSAFDLEMNVGDDHWYVCMKRLWSDFFPIPHYDDDNHPCSLTAIFADLYSAAYYSFFWSEMIAEDIKNAFLEGDGFKNEEHLKNVGNRLRNTFLSLGGSLSASEVFRKFRGRDPSYEHLLKSVSNN